MPRLEQRPPPDTVIWEITRRCDFKCFHCGASAGPARADELTSEEALRLCSDLKDLGTPSVCLMGGEVFLRKDWARITGTLRELGLNVGIITNGYLLSPEKMKEVTALGVCQVGVSLDASRPEVHDAIRGVRGACEAAKNAIRRLDDTPLAYKTVITSTSKKNIAELEGILAWLARHTSGFTWMINMASSHDPERFPRDLLLDGRGFLALVRFIHENRPAHEGRINITATHDTGYFSTRFPDLHDFVWQGCEAGIKTLGVQANGDVKGCLMLGDAHVEGNARETRLVDLWNDGDKFAMNRQFTAEMLTGACRGCEHGPECRAGCRDHAESFTGALYHYPFCLYRLETRGRV